MRQVNGKQVCQELQLMIKKDFSRNIKHPRLGIKPSPVTWRCDTWGSSQSLLSTPGAAKAFSWLPSRSAAVHGLTPTWETEHLQRALYKVLSLFPNRNRRCTFLYFHVTVNSFCSIAETQAEGSAAGIACSRGYKGRRSYCICCCQCDSTGNNIASKSADVWVTVLHPDDAELQSWGWFLQREGGRKSSRWWKMLVISFVSSTRLLP